MASRILHGASSSKASERKTSTLPRPRSSTRTQLSSGGGNGNGSSGSSNNNTTGNSGTASASSRLPQSSSTSIFGKSRSSRTKEKQPERSVAAVAASVQQPRRSAVETVMSPKQVGAAATASKSSARLATASAIPRGLAPGMGVTTQITSSGSAPVDTTLQPTRSLRRMPSLTSPHERYTSSENASTGTSVRVSSARHDPTNSREHKEHALDSVLDITIREPEGTTYTPISKPDYHTPTEYQTSNSRMELYMSKKLPHKLSTQNLPPPATTYANSSSTRDTSSTSSRFTETPSPFSRISTPNTAASSYSPSGASGPAPKLTPPRLRPSVSPTKTRPPVVRRKMPSGTPVDEFGSGLGLASVRENREASNQSSSSSSNSTIKASDFLDTKSGKSVLTGKLDRNPPPSAPLRVSSKRLPRPPLASDPTTGVLNIAEVTEQGAQISSERRQSRLPTSGIKNPPLRPSRQGMPPVESLEQGESPVIQSNLSHLATTGHTRRESLEKQNLASPDRTDNASPRRKLAKSPPKEKSVIASPPLRTRSKSSSRQLPTPSTDASKPSKRNQSPASTASATRSRFGLFTRRIKSPEQPSSSATRKGPIAGTGHEAYGKFGKPVRTRSGSTSSSGSRDKSASPTGTPAAPKSRQSSFTSNDGGRPQVDDFFEQRLRPVVISGGGAIKNNRNSQSGLDSSMYASSSAQSSLASIGSSILYSDRKATVTSSESSASMLSTSAGDGNVTRSLLPAPKITAKTESSRERSLAHRRSQQRTSHGEQSVRIPAPINVQMAVSKPVLDSRDTTQSSALETGSILSNDLMEGAWMKSGSSKDKGKSRMKSPRRWNLFSRNRSRSPKKSKASKEPTSAPSVAPNPVNVAVSDMGSKFVGHYAMMEDEDLSTDDRDIDDVLRDIEDNLDLRDDEGVIVTSTEEQPIEPRQVSMLLPSPPKLNAEFPKLEPQLRAFDESVPEQRTEVEQGVKRRPSRLQRVGRIPEHVTRRPSQSSFSRPFDVSGLPSTGTDRPVASLSSPQEQSPSRPKLTLQTERLPPTTVVEQWRQATYAPAPATNAFLHNLEGEQEFMSFAGDRQNSQLSGSSSSGNASFMNVVAQHAALAPRQAGDRPWFESDDLGDEAFELDSPEGVKILNAFPSLSNVRRTPPSTSPENKDAPGHESRHSVSPKKSRSPPLPDKPDHLVIPPHLHPATQSHNKSTSSEISDLNRSSRDRRNRLSGSSSISDSRYSSQTTISSSSHISAYMPSQINQVTRAMARKTHSTTDSLRFSALMTSRWLSFDRVLFSPVAEDILSLSIQAPRILILDGLANDDWSAYTALTYPNATVYNLSTTPKLRTPSPHGDEWANPPNHKLLPLPSTAHPFPFPKGFFAAVVVRFPPLLPQHHLSNVIAEGKRVLRPGGYLEMTLLDVDPINLGPKSRREVKRVKMRAQERMPDAGLAPVGDATMKLLARRGFEGLRTAVLNVPVATSPNADLIQGPGPLPFNEERASDQDTDRPNRNLGDLLREAGDESGVGIASQYPVAQAISKVARWWWSRCYEGLASVDGNDERGTLLGLRGRGEEDSRSMWANPAIVEECEERETNLRLMLAYAVKPMVARRRTVSV